MTNHIEIKDIPSLPLGIKKAINNETMAIFIGAGVSRLIGCDDWDTLTKKLVRKCREVGEIKPISENSLLEESDKIKLISICHNILSRDAFMGELKKSLKDSEVNNINIDDEKLTIYRDLKELANIFITTNADRYINKLMDSNNITINDFSFNNIKNDNLYKIHGCISDEQSLVFTKEKYITRYTDKRFNNFIDQFFYRYTVLFLGYSLSDFELLDRIFTITKSSRNNHFYLKAYFKHEQEVCNFDTEYFSNLNIKLIPFSRDENNYNQLKNVISEWKTEANRGTKKMQHGFKNIDDALENPTTSNIQTTIQNMRSDEKEVNYFFSKASEYQQLHLWLDPLFDAKFFSLNNKHEFQCRHILTFLEAVSIQKEPQAIEKLLSIANTTIKSATDDDIAWYMVKIIFNLPFEKIDQKHIDFIISHIRTYQYESKLNHSIVKIVLPVIIENKMKNYMVRLLDVIFGYTISTDTISTDTISIIEQHNLETLLKDRSVDIVNLVRIDGLEFIVNLIKEIIEQKKSSFDTFEIRTIRIKTEDEISQNSHSGQYEYERQLIFFTRDLLKSLSGNEIKPYIEDFLLKQTHSIFTRLALYAINCKYNDLKDIFWQWMEKEVECRKEYELWVLLKESSTNFTKDEFKKVIEWIEDFDCKVDRPDDDDEAIKNCNAYYRKEWLLCLKDSNSKARNLYQKYNRVDRSTIKHPGFTFWEGSFHSIPKYSYPNKVELCENPINTIRNFNPSEIEKEKFVTNNDLIRGLSNDLSICITNDVERFARQIDDFKEIDYIYKKKLIQGFSNAWVDQKKFNWGKVLNFITNELSPEFFNSENKHKQGFIIEIANLIELGTEKDKNAFDKQHLPVAKEILFKLLDNKYKEEENDISNDLSTHVLNSINGKVLHALIEYALRYGRLNSSRSIKWEDEIKEFFTEQLTKDDVYSLSVFTILGSYLHQLQFLDEQWVGDNFNKIFPLGNEQLWQASITAYFFRTNVVYVETYNLFKSNKHIEKILHTDFKRGNVRSRLISFICIAYICDIDESALCDVINSKNKDNILKVVYSIFQVYKNKENKEVENKIKTIWCKIYKIYKDEDEDSNTKKIFEGLTKWFVFLEHIYDQDMDFLKHTVNHTKEGWSYILLIKEMARLSNNHPIKIAKIYKTIVDNDIYPTYEKKHINKILANLKKKDRLEIRNAYRRNGIYDL
jgi:hypothetical protein